MTISDDDLVRVLRPFVRATRPVLDGLRESDPFGLRARVTPGSDRAADTSDEERSLADKILDALASVKVPGTSAWAAMDVPARSDWWVYRVGRFTTLIAAIPGLGGRWRAPCRSPTPSARRGGAVARRDRGRARRALGGPARRAAGVGAVPA